MQRDKGVLLDIVEAARSAIDFVAGMDHSAFLEDRKSQSSVLHQLMVIGEAVKRLSREFRDRHPEIEWTTIAGMRDALIHRYHDVDLDEVWRTIAEDLPALLPRVRELANSLPDNE
jgi:uncharacterized protein with HEPN domain